MHADVGAYTTLAAAVLGCQVKEGGYQRFV
jgi:hypothetical protein